MPVYVYVCLICDTTESVEADINSQPNLPTCSQCDKPMTRKFALGAIRFIGGGWGKDS